MEQVFLNLIINASHAMPGGGTLMIGTKYQTPDAGPGQAVVWLADTGAGIAPENLDRIFEPFFTTKGGLGESDTPGSGLGLSVSHGFVTAHGGSLSVNSELGSGSRFEIRLPMTEETEPAGDPTDGGGGAAEDAAGLKGARILAVEDDPDVLDLLQRLFAEVGSEATTVASATEAMEALGRREYDLVVADLMVPGGGRGVAEFLRGMGDAAPPLVITSGRLERALHDEMVAQGAARTIEKPFALSTLVRALSEVLQGG